ncbi:hypothetical protein DLP14_14635 [Salmonella enterica]|nr:hypothetical protein [Salmonella enterica]EMD7797638.1 DUF3577 domain-containing protein [Salmonella enterica]
MTTSSAQSSEYYDLHTFGFGYINDFRLVTPKKGKPFHSCRIRALRGPRDNVKYTFFDTIIPCKKVLELLEQCGDAAKEKAGNRVLIAFTVGDTYAEAFSHKGKMCCGQKGRLINIRMLKLDGNKIYPESTDTDRSVTDDRTVETFEIITRGIGYANRYYTYTSSEGESINFCSISALQGRRDEPEYTKFMATVNDDHITGLLEQCEDAFNEKRQIFISFNIKDLYPNMFEYKSGDRQGETGCNNRGVLSKIGLIMIDKHQVYPALQADEPETPSPENPAPEMPPMAPKKPRTASRPQSAMA